MSISQPVSCEASRTFWPRRPIASESWLLVSGTTTSMRSRSSSITTLATSAGASALTTKVAMSGDQGMMSIFSPCNSFTTACTREPRIPTQAPTGSTEESREITPILARDPGSRRDAAVFQRRQGVGDSVADLRAGIGSAGVFQRNLVRRVLDLIDHQHVTRQPQLALLGVDFGMNVGLAAVTGAGSLGDGVFH